MPDEFDDLIADAKLAATEGHPDNPVSYDLRGAIAWAQEQGYARRLHGDALNKRIIDAVVSGEL